MEINLASNLVHAQLNAICEVCEAAQRKNAPPPVESTIESIFCNYDSAFGDSIAKSFSTAAQQRIPVCGIWSRSCHESVKAVADRIKLILRPSYKTLNVEFRKAQLEESDEAGSTKQLQSYFEASIPEDAIKDVRTRWKQTLPELFALGVPERETIEFALQQELAQATRDTNDEEFRREVNSPLKQTPRETDEELVVSPDARSVYWRSADTCFEFTPSQAACFQQMHSAWKQRTPSLDQHTILEAAGTSSDRLVDIFEKGKHPAWNKLIVYGKTKGTFRLAPDPP